MTTKRSVVTLTSLSYLVLLVVAFLTKTTWAQGGWTDNNGNNWDGGDVEDNIDGDLIQDDEDAGGNNNNSTGQGLDCSFRGSISLIENLLTLEQIVNPDDKTLTVQLTYEALGWIAFGISPQGTMVGGEVVIAKTDEAPSATNPGKYTISAKSDAGVVLSNQQTLTDASFTQSNGQTILRFTKLLVEDGETEILAQGPNTFIYAVGSSDAFAYHGNTRGKLQLQTLAQCLQPGQDAPDDENSNNVAGSNDEVPNKSLWITHGILMAISWAILIPIGIGSSILRKLIPGEAGGGALWFLLHRICNGTAFLLMTAAFGIAVHCVNDQGTDHFSGKKHKTIGLVLYVLAFVQVLGGILRPHLPHQAAPVAAANGTTAASASAPPEALVEEGLDAESNGKVLEPAVVDATEVTQEDNGEAVTPTPKKSLQRIVFEVGHRIFGFGLLGLSWYNLYLGILALVAFYGSAYNKTTALWGVIGAISGIIFVLYIFQTVRGLPNKDEQK